MSQHSTGAQEMESLSMEVLKMHVDVTLGGHGIVVDLAVLEIICLDDFRGFFQS